MSPAPGRHERNRHKVRGPPSPGRCLIGVDPSFNRSRQSRGAHLTPWRNPRARRHRQSVWQDRRTPDLPVGFVELGQMPTRVRCEEGKFFHTPDLRSESGRYPDGVVAGCTTGHTRAATDSHAPGCRPPSAVPRATELRIGAALTITITQHQRNANRFDLTLGVGVVATVCLLGVLGWSGPVVAGRVRCAAGSGRASR